MSKWTIANIPNQSGRTAIVTGANTGLGFETARALALKGADVILACRNEAKGQDAVKRILAESPTGEISTMQLDLSDLSNTKAFATKFMDQYKQLDLLILNAGVMVPPESKTAQGFELQFGVNHLGHFALTGALLPLVQSTEGARVVVVSSIAANRGVMNFEDLNFEKRGYQAWPAYRQSKIANQLFALELQRRLKAAGSTVLITSAHPGWTATDLQRTSSLLEFLNRFIAMPTSQGALPTLRAACDPKANGGDYFGPHGFQQIRGYPKRVNMAKRAHNLNDAAQLWAISEELTGTSYGLDPENP